jgi:hypothetical protein
VDEDLRPDNIIVASHPDRPVLQHIDFGQSKLILNIDRENLQTAKDVARKRAMYNFKTTMLDILFIKAIQDPLSSESEAVADAVMRLRIRPELKESYRNRWNNARSEFRRKQTVGIRVTTAPKAQRWRPLMSHFIERFHGSVIKI